MEPRANVPQYFSVMSEDWTLESVTADLAALSGRTPEEMIGHTVWEFIRDPPARMRPYFTGALNSGQDVDGIANYVHANGGLIPYAYRLRRVQWDGGRCVIAQAGVPLSATTVDTWDRVDAVVSRVESALAATMDNPYLTVAAAVEYTSMSAATLRRWADAHLIERYGTPARRCYRKSELDHAMAVVAGGE